MSVQMETKLPSEDRGSQWTLYRWGQDLLVCRHKLFLIAIIYLLPKEL